MRIGRPVLPPVRPSVDPLILPSKTRFQIPVTRCFADFMALTITGNHSVWKGAIYYCSPSLSVCLSFRQSTCLITDEFDVADDMSMVDKPLKRRYGNNDPMTPA